MTEPQPGVYEHYKGKRYEVLGVGRNSETLDKLVFYRALYDSEEFGNRSLWARPREMFLEHVEVDGKMVPRFRRVSS